VEAVALRLHAEARNADPLDFHALHLADAAPAGVDENCRLVYFDRETATPTPVVSRGALTGSVAGPLIVEARDTTIVLPPGTTVTPSTTGSLVAVLEAVR
jgi:N-methylhydantoinase A/oxoprolinase/acetone carboxylase beta subunit